MMGTTKRLLAGAAALAFFGSAAAGQSGNGTAQYWMTAETNAGIGAAMAGGGNPAAMLRALSGRGPSHSKSLLLQLGSARRAAGAPSAEHVPPAVLQAGASLPLVSPKVERAAPGNPYLPPNMERPRGRMLIYWGCGERAGPGQPVVLDFATLSAGRVPAGFNSFRPMVPPSPGTHASYGEWPNERGKARIPAEGSLIGAHVVRGNYTPEMRFTLGPGQDFLAPVTLTSQSPSPSGAVPLAWRPVPGARAWFASLAGASSNGDMIMWTSSQTQMPAMAVDFASDADIQRLVQQKVLLPATADRCTVPIEVARAAPQSMLSLVALGGEANFAQPKPAGAAASWRPEWTAKLRTKSTHMGLLGMDMGSMMGDSGEDGEPAESATQNKRKGKNPFKKGLGRVLGN